MKKLVKSEIMKYGELGQTAFNTKLAELQQFGFITSENGNFFICVWFKKWKLSSEISVEEIPCLKKLEEVNGLMIILASEK